ncbi:hypothetical protein OG579_20425 [Williamsia herbipolensis]|uniref:ANTAR domain-containing protein n=1 Tax=Williamsia herbipolensis TaxID=1603258 RepID=A0AAU4K220_9NOCA|nr:hypothetical protein [Williamsia herbipolensis]
MTTPTTRTRPRNERRDLERRVEHARNSLRILAGLLVEQHDAMTLVRHELDALTDRHAALMAIAAIAIDDTGLLEDRVNA